jgi:hypothetical protein
MAGTAEKQLSSVADGSRFGQTNYVSIRSDGMARRDSYSHKYLETLKIFPN